MSVYFLRRGMLALLLAALGLAGPAPLVSAAEILVADRTTHSVYRIDATTGLALGTLISDETNEYLNQPTGIAVSNDYTKLYVSSFQTNSVIQYEYDYAAGTATNPSVFANTGLANPNSIRVGGDGTVYVSNLGGTGVARFNPDGSSAGAPLAGGDDVSLSGLAFHSSGNLLAAGFSAGSVAKTNATFSALDSLVAPNGALAGASGLLINGDDLYVVGMFAGMILKFDATTGDIDPLFGITDLFGEFPQDIMAAPDGNGFLVGVLGFDEGEGRIARYGFDGASLGLFSNPALGGFEEATAFAFVPEPASIGLSAVAMVALVLVARRRKKLN